MPAGIVAIPGQPGEYAARSIAGDGAALAKQFKVKITDGYASSGHAANGEHPVGLAFDIVPDPRRGGTWDDVDRLAAFAAKHPDIFRWVGYDGRFGTSAASNHGRGNHLHLSYHGRDGKPTKTLGGTVGGSISLAGSDLNTRSLASTTVTPANRGPDALKALLWVTFVLGGAVLAGFGVTRLFGLRSTPTTGGSK